MTTRRGFFTTMGVCGACAMAWMWTTDRKVSASDATAIAHLSTTALPAGDEGEAAYVSNKSCKKCHFKEYKSWAATTHAKALDILLPGNSAEAKTAHGLDPAKDYSADEKCVKCHVVGLGHDGGYKIGGGEKEMKDLIGVGCEMCHGAGGKYVEFHEQIMKEKKNYKDADMAAVGMTKVTIDTCKKCHNSESPTFDTSKPFDFDEMVKKNGHEMFELKYRQE